MHHVQRGMCYRSNIRGLWPSSCHLGSSLQIFVKRVEQSRPLHVNVQHKSLHLDNPSDPRSAKWIGPRITNAREIRSQNYSCHLDIPRTLRAAVRYVHIEVYYWWTALELPLTVRNYSLDVLDLFHSYPESA